MADEPDPVLVLTRRPDESIMIGDDVRVAVLSVSGEKVRLGIEAPADVPVHRKEVYLQIREEGDAPHTRTARSEGQDRTGH